MGSKSIMTSFLKLAKVSTMGAMATLGVFNVANVAEAHPCMELAVSKCPEAEGPALKKCLEEQTEKSEECQKWLDIQAECAEDLATHCGGMAYGPDAILCLSEWKYGEVSDKCKAALPPKETTTPPPTKKKTKAQL